MHWFLNFSVRAKVSVAMGLMVLLLGIVIFTAYRSIKNIEHSQARLYATEFANATDLLEDLRYQNAIRAAQLDMLILTNRSEQETWHQEIKHLSELSEKTHQALIKRNQDNPKLLERLNELILIRNEFKQTREAQIIPLIYQGKMKQAQDLVLGTQIDRFRKMRAIIEELQQQAAKMAQTAVEQSSRDANRAIGIFVATGLVAVLLSIAMIVLLNWVIASPLRDISNTAALIASGQLPMTFSTNGRADEVGKLTQTFSRMTDYLKETAKVADSIAGGDFRVTVKPQSEKDLLGNAFSRMTDYLKETAKVADSIAGGDLRVTIKPQSEKDLLGNTLATMVESLRRNTAELAEGANVLASSATEILAAATQVSSGAAETATAISETTTTVEEVKQTGHLSSQKAKYVVDSSQKAAEVARAGRKTVETSVAGMKHIQAQMDSIAESIVRLSEQSQTIGEIIASVNDLADQSNLLAVNAAIEAAKAGEQGKGFGVVAQEIKSLAEQSKQATAQVRNILSEIQKATSAAVMATEQGSKAVQSGVKQSAEVDESIRALADTIAEAAQAATQIAASIQQQLVGTDQVALAMESISQASTQNVAGTKQAETAALNLHELGQKFKRLVEQYRV
jgi:methyl-accepting chemotaxis protein